MSYYLIQQIDGDRRTSRCAPAPRWSAAHGDDHLERLTLRDSDDRRDRDRRRRLAVRVHRRRAAHRLARRRRSRATSRGFVLRRPGPVDRGHGAAGMDSGPRRRSTWRPACPACSRPATCGPSRPSGSPRRSARARWPSCSCTATSKGEAVSQPRAGQRNGCRATSTNCGTLFLFEKLTDEQLTWLCEHGRRRRASSRAWSTREGDPATLLLRAARGRGRAARAGSAATTSRSPAPTSAASTPAPGTPTCGDRVPQTYTAVDAGARRRPGSSCSPPTTSRQLMQRLVPDGRAPAGGPVLRQRSSAQEAIGQRERLLALGSLSAGLTHELNNPAAAAVRATAALRERVAGMRHKLALIAGGRLRPAPLRDADPAAGATRSSRSPRRPS